MPVPRFDDRDLAAFDALLRWRRDVRHFLPDPVDPALVLALLEQACLAPSVGHAQPWRFVLVESPPLRAAVQADFERCRAEAEAGIPLAKRGAYGRAKLEGFQQAPVHLAVFTDAGTARGHGLGRHSMPESLHYSTVMAIHSFWLAARLRGLGVGWVSILDPAAMESLLAVPQDWRFSAYLCVGHPAFQAEQPELEALGWEQREAAQHFIHRR
jgi:5,6-dimethylbenzimidazole synthase